MGRYTLHGGVWSSALGLAGAGAVVVAPNQLWIGYLLIAAAIGLALWGIRKDGRALWVRRREPATKDEALKFPSPDLVEAHALNSELRVQLQKSQAEIARARALENRDLAKKMDEAITVFQTPTRPGVLPDRVTRKGPNHLIVNGLRTLGVSPEREREKMTAKREEIERNTLYCVLSDSDKAIWASEKDKQAYHIQIAQMEGLRELLKEAGFL